MTALTDLLAEHNGVHMYSEMPDDSPLLMVCNSSSCDWSKPFVQGESWDILHRAHLATAIEAHYATELDRVRAEAWDEGTAAPRMVDGSEEPAIANPYRTEPTEEP